MTHLPAVGENEHILGKAGAPIVLVEYGDFECPFTTDAIAAVEEARDEFGERLLFVYRSFPLWDIHPHAQRAAEAGEAAGAQGKFWPMFVRLFGHPDELEDHDLLRHAQRIGLDIEQFQRDMESHTHLPRLQQQVADAEAAGVSGTPTFFVNGERHHHREGLWQGDRLLQLLRQAAQA